MYKPNRLFPIAIISLITVLLLCAPAAGRDSKKMDLKKISVSDAAAKHDTLIFLDARPVKVFKEGHIPNARSFSWEKYTRTDAEGVTYRTFPPEELAVALGNLGISNTDAVVVYGDADTSWGGEGWLAWVLAWLGHEGPVYCMDGGFPLWKAEGHPVAKYEKNEFSKKTYTIHLKPDKQITAKEIARAGKSINFVDTRSYFTEFLPGHLPGAVHINWKKFYKGSYHRFLSRKAVKNLLEKNGVDLNKPVVYYCTGGIRSGFAWMVHQLAGLPNAVNFEGGTEEWIRMKDSMQ